MIKYPLTGFYCTCIPVCKILNVSQLLNFVMNLQCSENPKIDKMSKKFKTLPGPGPKVKYMCWKSLKLIKSFQIFGGRIRDNT